MKAYLDHTFRKGFLLKEESIIKLHDIIIKRLNEKHYDNKLLYKIYRKDALVYDTNEYNRIIEEENSKRNSINKLELTYNDDNLKLKLIFDKIENTQLEIEANEKDFAYLLFSDIKEYLSTEVMKFRTFLFKDVIADRLLFPLVMMIVMILSFNSIDSSTLSQNELSKLLNTNAIEEKLNFLIRNTQRKINTSNFLYILFGVTMLYVLGITSLGLLDKIFPRNIFYLGKEIVAYDKICSIRSKIIWGIIIAMIIGIISGLVVFGITK
jgi:hypothetical protein